MTYCTVIMMQLIGLYWKYITDRLTYLYDRNLEDKPGSELAILTSFSLMHSVNRILHVRLPKLGSLSYV